MTDRGVLQQQRNGVLELRLNHPPLNPIGVAQVEQLCELIPAIEQDDVIRCVVIRGEGEHFSAGANLKEGDIVQQRGPKQVAADLAEKPPRAVAAILRVISRSQDLPLSQALKYELDEFSGLAGTRDNIEGVMAMFEKRKPLFTGE